MDNIWYVLINEFFFKGVLYGYCVDGLKGWGEGYCFDSQKVLFDFYVKLVEGCCVFGDLSQKMVNFFGIYDFIVVVFDWGEGYQVFFLFEKDFIIYEMSLCSFIRDEFFGLE